MWARTVGSGAVVALLCLGPAGPAGAEEVVTSDPTVTAEAVPVTTADTVGETSTAESASETTTDPAPPPDPVVEEPAVQEPPAETVVTEPAPSEPVPTDQPATDPAPVDPVAEQPSDPQVAPSSSTDPTASASTTSGSTTGTTTETSASAATEEVLDGQGTGDDVPVLESLPSVPNLPGAGATAQGLGPFPTVPAPSSIAVALTGWTNPAIGRLTSSFGPRIHPVLGTAGIHAGQDIAARCGSPVYAAASGVVVWAGGALQGRTGNQLVIAHGDGVVTRYGHLLSGTVLVRQGDTVQAGQRIASVGGDRALDPLGAGNSTGCHLHFEVNLANGANPVDPLAFLAARGVRLGSDQPIVVVAPVDVAAVVVQQAAVDQTAKWRKPPRSEAEILLGGRLPVVAVRTVG